MGALLLSGQRRGSLATEGIPDSKRCNYHFHLVSGLVLHRIRTSTELRSAKLRVIQRSYALLSSLLHFSLIISCLILVLTFSTEFAIILCQNPAIALVKKTRDVLA